MSKTRKHIQNDNGFTLVELMVTVLLTAIAVVSIYRGYTAFSQAADAQQQVMEMQQNLRIGMTWLAADIRRAGMNEDGEDVAGFIAADATSVEFSMDLGSANGPVVFATDGADNDDDGVRDNDPNPAIAALEAEEEGRMGDVDVTDDGESIIYYLETDLNGNGTLDPDEDFNGNGVLDENLLQRQVWDSAADDYGPAQTIITNVEALDFVYFNDTAPTTPLAVPLSTTDLLEVDRVEITLVVRATNEDYRYTDTAPYLNLQGTTVYDPVAEAVPPYVDPATGYLIDGRHVRRRAFSMSVQIRNNI